MCSGVNARLQAALAMPPLCYNFGVMPDVRPSPIAGTWYPGESGALEESIDELLADAPAHQLPGALIGLIVPHAGHRYSGRVAAHAFRCASDLQPEAVVIVSPYHQSHPAELLTSSHQAYWTPLGEVPIDQARVERVRGALLDRGVPLQAISQDVEHSLEIELPFLQRALAGPFAVVPIMMRDQSRQVAHALGEALASALEGGGILLVASTDLSHFHPAETARKFDQEMLARMEAFQPDRILAAEEEGVGFACGRAAVAAVLIAAKAYGADHVRVLAYAHSGDVTGDLASVVGYGSAAISRDADRS